MFIKIIHKSNPDKFYNVRLIDGSFINKREFLPETDTAGDTQTVRIKQYSHSKLLNISIT